MAEKAQNPHSKLAKIVAWLYAAILVVMVVAQLVAFEDFTPLISANYLATDPYGMAAAISGLIVFTEIFALPFLLRMALSPLMRWFSMACGLAAAALWIRLTVGAVVSKNYFIDNYGLLGSKVPLHAGTVAVVISVALVVLAVWSAWGLWPARRK